MKAYRSLHRFRHDAELGTWLYRVVYNACVDDLRRARHRPEPVDVGLLGRDRPTTEPGPERVVDAADQARRALAALPEEQRATVVLVDGEGFDNVTAAGIMGVAPGTVASRLSRARASMRRTLEEARP